MFQNIVDVNIVEELIRILSIAQITLDDIETQCFPGVSDCDLTKVNAIDVPVGILVYAVYEESGSTSDIQKSAGLLQPLQFPRVDGSFCFFTPTVKVVIRCGIEPVQMVDCGQRIEVGCSTMGALKQIVFRSKDQCCLAQEPFIVLVTTYRAKLHNRLLPGRGVALSNGRVVEIIKGPHERVGRVQVVFLDSCGWPGYLYGDHQTRLLFQIEERSS